MFKRYLVAVSVLFAISALGWQMEYSDGLISQAELHRINLRSTVLFIVLTGFPYALYNHPKYTCAGMLIAAILVWL